jgi:Ser/Thr protein kinase RdoA (MazF antagonist)
VSQATAFTAESSHTVLVEACGAVGLTSDGAELIRLGENALYMLRDESIVVRIARHMGHWDDAVKEVRVAEWLASHRFSGAQVANQVEPQPLEVAGHPVTFWSRIVGRDAVPDEVGLLGDVLRRFHTVPKPTKFRLNQVDPLTRVARRIESAEIPDSDKRFLIDRCAQIEVDLHELEYQLEPTVTHGDAHIKNLMIATGRPVLIDFEGVRWGQPEWDLSMTATEYATAGWWTEGQYSDFVDAYGFDVLDWPGFPVIRKANELKMTTWLMQNVSQAPEIAREFRNRMRTIRDGYRVGWRPF